MIRYAQRACATTLALTLCACKTAPTVDTDAEVKALKAFEQKQNEDYAAKNTASLISDYADDAVMISPGGATVKGKAALQASMSGMINDPAFSLHFAPDEVKIAKSGDLAYTQGTYTLGMTNPSTHQPMTDKGSYVTTYIKTADGQWKILTDIVTSQTPMPGQ